MNLAAEVERTADRLGTMSEARLVKRAAEVHRVLQRIADAGRAAAGRPQIAVPRLAPRAWADQVVVIGGEAVAAMSDTAAEPLAEELVRLRRMFDESMLP